MIICEALENFDLKRFDEIKNLKRGTEREEEGKLFRTDVFECEKELANYLLGENPLKRAVVKIVEIIPEKTDLKLELNDEESKELEKAIIKEAKKVTKKTTTKKK